MKKLNKPSISVESIPEELKACNQWVMYRLMKKPGKVKPDRVPMRANFSNASVTNPKTWCSFDDAVSALKKKNFITNFIQVMKIEKRVFFIDQSLIYIKIFMSI